jgi:hypothetical protein
VNKPVGKPEGNIQLGRFRLRRKDDNEMDPKQTGLRMWKGFRWPRIVSSGNPL